VVLGLSGRTAAVASASAGLGFATALALSAEGVKVAIRGRDPARIERAAQQIGKNAMPLVADVGDAKGGVVVVQQASDEAQGEPRVGRVSTTAPAGSIPVALSSDSLWALAAITWHPARRGRGARPTR